jgi:predicted amidohydrolase
MQTISSKSLRVLLLQLDIVWENAEENMHTIENHLSAVGQEADLIVLPEMFSSGFTMNPKKVAQSMGGEVVMWMKKVARDRNSVLMGSLVIEEDNAFFNRLLAVFPNGDIEFYNKRHLFRMGGENEVYKRGAERKIIQVNGWRLLPLICYDLRFPVWSRNVQDYDLLLYVANWPAARQDVWYTLLKARAIENQSYVIGVNRVGKDPQIDYNGQTLVFNARGEVLLNGHSGRECNLYVKLDLTAQNNFREKFPVWKDGDSFMFGEDIV